MCGQLADQAHRVADRQRALTPESLSQALALHEGHGVVRQPVDRARGVDRYHVWMLEPCSERDLALEAPGGQAGDEVGMKDPDDHPPAEARVMGRQGSPE